MTNTPDDESPSSNDDGLRDECAPQFGAAGETEASHPWWATDPTLAAKRDEVSKWLEALEAEPEPIPDDWYSAISREINSGSCRRELSQARLDLNRARVRYTDAIRAARAAGYSWGEIGNVLGVPRQLLHRRFRYEVD